MPTRVVLLTDKVVEDTVGGTEAEESTGLTREGVVSVVRLLPTLF